MADGQLLANIVSLDAVLATDEFLKRPARQPDYKAESRALAALAQELGNSPLSILQRLVETTLSLCQAHSSGISLLDNEQGKTVFQLGAMGYKFQFITLAGFHSLNYSMFHLAHGYAKNNMSAFVELQEAEFAAAEKGFTAVKHQREVGTGYFDAVTTTIERDASTAALKGSTEDEQFFDRKHA